MTPREDVGHTTDLNDNFIYLRSHAIIPVLLRKKISK